MTSRFIEEFKSDVMLFVIHLYLSLNKFAPFLRVDERSSDSYICSDVFFVFFSGRVLKLVQAQVYFFSV